LAVGLYQPLADDKAINCNTRPNLSSAVVSEGKPDFRLTKVNVRSGLTTESQTWES